METRFIIKAHSPLIKKPLCICIWGGRLEVLGFSHGKKVAIEEAFGRITISIVDDLEEGSASVEAVLIPFEPSQSMPQKVNQEKNPSTENKNVSAEKPHLSLFEQLVALRKQISSELHFPPYIIFNDATLKEMADSMPLDMEALKAVKGVGDAKLERFGARFLEVIRKYAQKNSESEG